MASSPELRARLLKPRVELGWVSCLGRCDGPPAVLVELHATGNPDKSRVVTCPNVGSSTERLRAVISAHLSGAPLPPDPVDRSPLSGLIDPYRPRSPESQAHEPYAAARRFADSLKKAGDDASRVAVGDALVETLKTSDLRGMGGAGRPVFSKWAEVREESKRALATYLICNGDESEPSTFKDRELLLRAPHLVIEGMVLGALLVGARRGYVYIRHEYPDQVHAIEAEILEPGRGSGRPRRPGHRAFLRDRGLREPWGLCLRRAIGVDRGHRGAPRRASQSSPGHRGQRPSRQAYAFEQCGVFRLGSRNRAQRRGLVSRRGLARDGVVHPEEQIRCHAARDCACSRSAAM